ncbi:MAG: hypothetical protein M1812_004170 [Candelaria pacifica]|nr:MAG: hypothetical protein M1812_004170 [Candelaria pacifica]
MMLLLTISFLVLPTLIRAQIGQAQAAAELSDVPALTPSTPVDFVAISTLLQKTPTTGPEVVIELREVVDPNGQPVNAAPGAVPAANGAAPVANQPAAAPAAAPVANQPAAVPANGAVGGAAAGGGVAPAAGAGAPTFTQASPVTTIFEPTMINGVSTQVAVVYSQQFSSVPNQGPTPAAGSIGMGTLTGAVGAVKTQATNGAVTVMKGSVGGWALGICAFGIMVGI